MVEASVGFRRPTKFLISHLHGDHILGLPGLLQTMDLLGREKLVSIFGSEGMIDFVHSFNCVLGYPDFPVILKEISSNCVVLNESEYCIRSIRADHDPPSWSYVFEEHPIPGKFHPEEAFKHKVPEGPLWKKLQLGEDVFLEDGTIVRSRDVVDDPKNGIKIGYSGDTRPNNEFIKASTNAEIIIHEATFDDSLEDKANENGHSTASQAAEVAKRANAKLLILTHISSRYPNAEILLDQAREIFSNTLLAEDLMKLELNSILR
jgi:ribonuclease Z